MPQRLNYLQRSRELPRTLAEFGPLAQIEGHLRELVEIRASQLNGCAFGVDCLADASQPLDRRISF
ncbi:hypothetical protein [Cupriavidus oxalaticus]|uniref:hypothetical protein n=1 Tax=Cupriavidus oxalaticus TaxID=96344 RepID=UPI00316DE4FD